MKINQKMLDAAKNALGYDVDKERIRLAYDNVDTRNLPLVKSRLKQLEKEFSDAGGRGVELAEEIDNMRIYLATRRKAYTLVEVLIALMFLMVLGLMVAVPRQP